MLSQIRAIWETDTVVTRSRAIWLDWWSADRPVAGVLPIVCEYDRGYAESEMIKPQYVVEKLCTEITGGDAYITSDVGQHQMFAAQYYQFDEPRRWINSGGLGTMGFGLPAAHGCEAGLPR